MDTVTDCRRLALEGIGKDLVQLYIPEKVTKAWRNKVTCRGTRHQVAQVFNLLLILGSRCGAETAGAGMHPLTALISHRYPTICLVISQLLTIYLGGLQSLFTHGTVLPLGKLIFSNPLCSWIYSPKWNHALERQERRYHSRSVCSIKYVPRKSGWVWAGQGQPPRPHLPSPCTRSDAVERSFKYN